MMEPQYYNCHCEAVSEKLITSLLRGREDNSHKGTYGHALLIAGSKGMMGAAVLCTGAALKSGCGLVTVHVPCEERQIIHITHPSAIVDCDPEEAFSCFPDSLEKYRAIGIGCGLGQSEMSATALEKLLKRLCGIHSAKPEEMRPKVVLDADALNIISGHPEMLSLIPPHSILTPHAGELCRLAAAARQEGLIQEQDFPWDSREKQTLLTMELSSALNSIMIQKGYGTRIIHPGHNLMYINTTGNPGMAKGGSGDILTGLITGLCARGYSGPDATVLGVWFHGKAGDEAAEALGMESMCASDILDHLHIG